MRITNEKFWIVAEVGSDFMVDLKNSVGSLTKALEYPVCEQQKGIYYVNCIKRK